MPLMKEKRLSFGNLQVAIALEAAQAERLTRAAPYRHAVRPALRWLAGVARRGVRPAAGAPLPAAAPPAPAPLGPEGQAILERLKGIDWYHTIDLPHGAATPGFVDHREQVSLYGLPASLAGKRCLDVATYDGFWAFEMEKRGAAEVVAIDLESMAQCDIPRRLRASMLASGGDRPTGAGFRLVKELLGSRVERRFSSVYDLAPEKVGTFDLVFLSDLLLHLRDPMAALESVFSVVSPQGCAIVAEPYNPALDAFPQTALTEFAMHSEIWWLPGAACLKKMLGFAGFDRVEEIARFRLNTTVPLELRKVVFKAWPAGPEVRGA
jgi:tRNA (mo5U34)-methyltransferase